MNWRITILTLSAAALLSGCNGHESSTARLENGSYGGVADVAEMAPSMSKPAPPPPGAPAPEPQQQAGSPSVQSFLAYRYNYAFALPAKTVAKTAETHAEQCRTAGPSICQVLSSSTNSYSDSNINASLQLRAEPKWLEGFTGEILQSVEDANGELTNKSVSAEDLTRQILDTDARLKAQKTLRNRLEQLLETKNADLKDLLALEREFARVQGEIESATTTLNVLRKRVSMSVVDLNYSSQQVAVSRSALSPIGRAIKGFAGTAAYSLAAVIDFIAAILPWFIVILPGLWILRWFWRKRRRS